MPASIFYIIFLLYSQAGIEHSSISFLQYVLFWYLGQISSLLLLVFMMLFLSWKWCDLIFNLPFTLCTHLVSCILYALCIAYNTVILNIEMILFNFFSMLFLNPNYVFNLNSNCFNVHPGISWKNQGTLYFKNCSDLPLFE